MDHEQEIKKLEAQTKELEAQIKELKAAAEAEQELPPVWVPEYEDSYYVANQYGVQEYYWFGDSMDESYLKVGNVFQTKQEAENYIRALELIETLRRERFKAQGDWWPSRNEVVFTMRWNHHDKFIDTVSTTRSRPSDVFGFWRYLNALRDVSKKHESGLRWYFTEYLPSVN